MSDELFPAESVQMDSPRLAWIKKHGVVTYFHHNEAHGWPPTWFAGFQKWWPELSGFDFWANETARNCESRCACAGTEDEALTQLAVYYRIPLWNEEGGAM
jgi:hypothetical protein